MKSTVMMISGQSHRSIHSKKAQPGCSWRGSVWGGSVVGADDSLSNDLTRDNRDQPRNTRCTSCCHWMNKSSCWYSGDSNGSCWKSAYTMRSYLLSTEILSPGGYGFSPQTWTVAGSDESCGGHVLASAARHQQGSSVGGSSFRLLLLSRLAPVLLQGEMMFSMTRSKPATCAAFDRVVAASS